LVGSNQYLDMLDAIARSNLEVADRMGLLDEHKMVSGVPLNYKFVTDDEIEILKKAGIQYWPRRCHPGKIIGAAFGGWVQPYIREALDLHEETEYADMPLVEMLKRMFNQWP
jgi:hypothetical protein